MFDHNLRFETTSFVGRENELSQIADLLTLPDCRLVTLTGPGGIGKTRLAIEAMAAQSGNFADGVHFVPLTSINVAESVSAAIATALPVTFYSSNDLRIQIVQHLREKHMLLILDNFEHVLEATDLLIELLQAAPDVKYLVTSRERLNLREEWVLMLEGLPFPKDETDVPVENYSAVRLFAQRARQVQATFSLKDNLPAVRAICERVAGMPLAIELASTWLRTMSCLQIVAHLDDSLDFLTSPLRDVSERHRSMRGVFEQSWHLLSAVEQQVLMYLSVFRGGFDHEAAEQVAGASLSVLASLSDKSMIRLNAAERYDLHELLRQFAAEKLADSDGSQAAYQRHCDYFLKLAESADAHAFGREQIAWFDRLEIELNNLRAAVFWSLNTETGLRLAGTLRWFLSERGHWREGADWLERTLAANPDVSPSIRARAFLSLAAHVDDERANALCDEAFSLARRVGDRWNMAWALCQKPILASSDPRHSVETLDASLALFRQIHDSMGIAHTLVRLSMYTEDDAYARLLLDEAEMIAQKTGDKIILGWVMNGLGIIAWRQNDLDGARLHCINGLAFFDEARFKMGYESLLMLGIIQQELGNQEQARSAYTDALLTCHEMYQSDYYSHLLGSLAWLTRRSVRYAHSATRLGAVNSPDMGHDANSSEMNHLNTDAAALRDYLGEALLSRMGAACQAMNLDEAIICLEVGVAQIINQPANRASNLESAHPQTPANEPLTEREQEILRLLGDGLNSREIADRLFLSVGTIRWYLKQIYSKLDAHSRSQAIAHARELNLLA